MKAKNQQARATAITVRLFEPMYVDFDRQLSGLLIKRDAFIDRMISVEIPHARSDLEGKELSPVAKRYIAGRLKNLGKGDHPPLKQVCISVRPETADALDRLVKDHNLVRDAFLNRLIMLLRSSDALLEALDLPKRINGFSHTGTQDMPTSPMKAIEEIQWDPLYYLRNACMKKHDCGLYDLPLPEHLDAFSCFLPDEEVPRTLAHAQRLQEEEEWAALLIDLENFESGLSGKTGR